MEETYKKSKGSAGQKGVQFQLDLVTVCLLNALHYHKNWKISSENPIGGKYDDIVIELDLETAIFIQAKHKENRKITKNHLLSDNSRNADFSLSKYFFSYEEIKNKFQARTVIICTNTAMNTKGLEDILTLQRAQPGSLLYHESDCSFYSFNENILPDLKKSAEAYLGNNSRDKGVGKAVVTEENLKYFLKNLQFFSCYPCEDYLHRIIEESLSRLNCSNLCRSISCQEILKKVEDWFQQPKGEYLTEARTKAMLCEIRSDKYCESLKEFNVSFGSNNLDIAGSQKIIHIQVKEGYMLQILKIYHALRGDNSRKLYVDSDDAVEVQKNVVEAFDLRRYKFLIMAWDAIKDKIAKGEIIGKLKEVLQKNEHKKVILVADTDVKLSHQFGPEHINQVDGTAAFHDLSEDSQVMLLERENIIFQGATVTLQELLQTKAAEDYAKYLNSTMLAELVRGNIIHVGLPPLALDNDTGRYYVSRRFQAKREAKDIRNTLTEEDLYHAKEKMIAISESAGMGKSTVLTKMAVTIKESNPSLWVIKINLNEYSSALRNFVKTNTNKLTAAELLNSLEATQITSEFEKLVFSMSGKVVLMLDGVDEISPDYTDLVLSLLSHCQEAPNFAKIFIATRPHVDLKLIDAEQFTMLPFSESEQIQFLVDYWSHNLHLHLNYINKLKCKAYATKLLEKIISWMSVHHWKDHFTDIPLQIRMVAEIFQENTEGHESGDWEGCKEYLEKDEIELKLPQKFNIAELYDLFIEKKRDIFIDKGSSRGSVTATPALLNQFEACLAYHRSLAISILLSEHQHLFKTQFLKNNITEEYIFKIGIVQRLNGGIQFIHRTFAEYFLADCIVQELKLQKPDAKFQWLLIDRILVDDDYKIVRTFLDVLLQKVSLPPNIFKQYRSLVDEKSNSKLIFKLAEGGHVAILQLIMENVHFKVIKERSVDVTDWRLRIPFRKRNTLKDLAVLVRQGGVNIKNEVGKCPLDLAVIGGHLKMVNFLLQQGANVNVNYRGFPLMYIAISRDALDIVACLVEHGYDINVRKNYYYGNTALHAAAYHVNLDIIKYLVEHGADINAKTSEGATALDRAIFGWNYKIVKYLVQHGADVNAKDYRGDTAFGRAVYDRNYKIVKYLVKHGADLNTKDSRGATTLGRAIYDGDYKIVKCLVEHGADVNAKDYRGDTALGQAIYGENWNIVKYLVEHGSELNPGDEEGLEFLHLAAKFNKIEIVEYLLKHGVDINMEDSKNNTSLHWAIYAENWDIVKYLVEHGADANAKDYRGTTALGLAIHGGNWYIVKYLVDHGIDVNTKDSKGNTVLGYAIYSGNWNIVKYLVEHGADVNAGNEEGLASLHLAAKFNEMEIVEYLLEHGADINIKDRNSNTPLHWATYAENWNIAKFLVDHGADVNAADDDGFMALHSGTLSSME